MRGGMIPHCSSNVLEKCPSHPQKETEMLALRGKSPSPLNQTKRLARPSLPRIEVDLSVLQSTMATNEVLQCYLLLCQWLGDCWALMWTTSPALTVPQNAGVFHAFPLDQIPAPILLLRMYSLWLPLLGRTLIAQQDRNQYRLKWTRIESCFFGQKLSYSVPSMKRIASGPSSLVKPTESCRCPSLFNSISVKRMI